MTKDKPHKFYFGYKYDTIIEPQPFGLLTQKYNEQMHVKSRKGYLYPKIEPQNC